MSEGKATAFGLKESVTAGIAICALGLFIGPQSGDFLLAGLLIVIVSPIIGVLFLTIKLASQRDMFWIKVALVLISIIAISLAATLIGIGV